MYFELNVVDAMHYVPQPTGMIFVFSKVATKSAINLICIEVFQPFRLNPIVQTNECGVSLVGFSEKQKQSATHT